jgi:hypothetical protein
MHSVGTSKDLLSRQFPILIPFLLKILKLEWFLLPTLNSHGYMSDLCPFLLCLFLYHASWNADVITAILNQEHQDLY